MAANLVGLGVAFGLLLYIVVTTWYVVVTGHAPTAKGAA